LLSVECVYPPVGLHLGNGPFVLGMLIIYTYTHIYIYTYVGGDRFGGGDRGGDRFGGGGGGDRGGDRFGGGFGGGGGGGGGGGAGGWRGDRVEPAGDRYGSAPLELT